MKVYLFVFFALLVIGCAPKQRFGPEVVSEAVERASSEGMLIIYNQGGSNHFINFRLVRDREYAFLELFSQIGLKIADVYKRKDSIWVVVPMESTVYFQSGSNSVKHPMFNTPGFPIGMLFDIMGANFKFSHSVISGYDFYLADAINSMNYSFYGGQLARTEYRYKNKVINKSFKYSGDSIRVNVKRDGLLMITVSINNLQIGVDVDHTKFNPQYPEGFRYVELADRL